VVAVQGSGPLVPVQFEFRGSAVSSFFNSLGAALLSVFTLGLAVPWAKAMRFRWVTEHTYINGRPLRFTGSGGQLWGQYIKWWLLCLVTLGLYSIVVSSRLRAWAISHQEGAVDAPMPQLQQGAMPGAVWGQQAPQMQPQGVQR
jgi:hypothetical protein